MDTTLIQKRYQFNSHAYDLVTQLFAVLRSRAIELLQVQPGMVVMDFGCGTGLSFLELEQRVGTDGRIIGIDLSSHMLAQAYQKIQRYQWQNVSLVQANAEVIALAPGSVDAVLSFYTNDIMTSPRAVANAVTALRPGGRFVAAGIKLSAKRHGRLINPITLAYSHTAITQPASTHPWMHLEDHLGPLMVEEHLWDSSYIACGKKADQAER